MGSKHPVAPTPLDDAVATCPLAVVAAAPAEVVAPRPTRFSARAAAAAAAAATAAAPLGTRGERRKKQSRAIPRTLIFQIERRLARTTCPSKQSESPAPTSSPAAAGRAFVAAALLDNDGGGGRGRHEAALGLAVLDGVHSGLWQKKDPVD